MCRLSPRRLCLADSVPFVTSSKCILTAPSCVGLPEHSSIIRGTTLLIRTELSIRTHPPTFSHTPATKYRPMSRTWAISPAPRACPATTIQAGSVFKPPSASPKTSLKLGSTARSSGRRSVAVIGLQLSPSPPPSHQHWEYEAWSGFSDT
ncbi:hypothetical protein VFPBJ_11652 [Purpureocillium lilacinum]|uniref:Uncharacterized protein n=1 Tax=Purpureocillium lilacinum TaxID=33203 RepID=A0A179F129_PURLI|nr:hypothetical protein VFPBJ_11652 [Purpureocillium lilacinum]